MKCLLTLLLIGFLANPVFGSSIPPIDIDNIESITWARAQNIEELQKWAQENIRKYDPDSSPDRWVRAVHALISSARSRTNVPGAKALLVRAKAIAHERGLLRELWNLETAEYYMEVEEATQTGRTLDIHYEVSLIETLVEKARAYGLKNDEAMAHVMIAQRLRTVDIAEAMRRAALAQKLMAKSPHPSVPEEVIMVRNLAKVLLLSGAEERADKLFLYAYNLARKYQLSYQANRTISDYTIHLIDSRRPKDMEKARQLVLEAYPKADAVHRARHELALAKYYLAKGLNSEAVNYGQKAYNFFKEQNSRDMLETAAGVLGEAFYRTGDVKQAYDYFKLTRAEMSTPAKVSAAMAKTELLLRLNNFDEAYSNLKQMLASFAEEAANRRKNIFLELLAQLSLTLEEQRTVNLELEEAVLSKKNSEHEKQRRQEEMIASAMSWLRNGIIATLAIILGGFWILRRQNQSISIRHAYLVNHVLEKFIPKELAEKVASGESILDKAPEQRLVTILFCRITGLETMSQTLPAEDLAMALSELNQVVAQTVQKHQGRIDKFQRGQFLIEFGILQNVEPMQQAMAAQACSLELMQSIKQWLIENELADFLDFKAAAHQGTAFAGAFGGGNRIDFTVLGSSVNIASRLETMAQPGEVIFTEAIAQHCTACTETIPEYLSLRGVIEEQRVWRLRQESIARSA